MLRALVHALAAQTALLKVNVCQVILKGDCLKRAGLDALATTYAGCIASLLGNGPLVLVYATYIDPAVQFVFVAEFNYVTRAGLGACSAGCALVLIHLRQSGLRVHPDSIELTCLYAVSATQTAVETAYLPTVHQGGHGTAPGSVISTRSGAVLA